MVIEGQVMCKEKHTFNEEVEAMTDAEERIVNIDKRQESFETFMRAYIDGNEKRIERIDSRMDRFEARMDKLEGKMDNLSNQFNNLLIAGGVGVLTIIVTILASK